MEPTDLTRKAQALKDLPAAVFPPPARKPRLRIAAMWFAVGVGLASLLGFFFDSRRGSARRHMAVDRTMAAGRDVKDWSGKKVRHWRNKALGVAAEIEHADEPKLSEKTGSGSR